MVIPFYCEDYPEVPDAESPDLSASEAPAGGSGESPIIPDAAEEK